MRHKLTAGFLVMILAGWGTLDAQKTESPLRADVFFAKTVVQLRDGSAIYGFLAGLEPETLIIRKGPDDVRISSQAITKIVLSADQNRGGFLMMGGLAGIYLGNFGLLRAGHQPTAFIRDEGASAWGYIFANTVYAAAGMGLGFLASLFEKSEREFMSDPDPARRQAGWQKFRAFVTGASRPAGRVRVYLQTARVFPSASGRIQGSFSKAGYSESYGYFPGDLGREGSYDRAGNFNLLRGVRLTVAVKPRLEVGAAVVFLGEPTVGGDEGSYSYSYANPSGPRSAGARFDSTGYFVVGSFDALAGRSAKSLRWKIGLGAGTARAEFDLSFAQPIYTSPYGTNSAGYSFVKSFFCPLLFTEIQIPVARNLSIGICGDFVPAPSRSIPAFPEWGLPAQKIRLGNGSVGASLGLSF